MSDVVLSSDIQLDQLESPARDYLKCPQCRKDGKKCSQDTNQSITARVKCCRCARLGHPCGPRERAVGRRKKTTTMTEQNTAHNTGLRRFDHELLDPKETVFDGRWDAHLSNCFPLSDKLFELINTQRVFLRCRCELAPLLNKLPNDPVFRQHDDSLKFGVCKLNSRHQAFMACGKLQADQQRERLSPVHLLLYENLQLNLEVLQQQHLRLNTTDLNADLGIAPESSTSRIRVPILAPPRLKRLSYTQHITTGIDSLSLHLRGCATSVCELDIQEYATAQAQLQPILEEIFAKHVPALEELESNEHSVHNQSMHTIFPASHLAYWNLDREAAFKIATQSGTLDLSPGLFDRTLIHLAVQARDIGFLKRLADFDPDTFIKACMTGDKHSPLDLATILNDSDVFELLFGRCVSLYPWTQHLLHLAVAANSANTVRLILERGMIALPPYTDIVAIAINKGFENVAMQFLPWLTPPCTSQHEISLLIVQARRKRLCHLAESLRNMAQPESVSDQALSTLQQHFDFLTGGQLDPTLTSPNNSDFLLFGQTEPSNSSQSSLLPVEVRDVAQLGSYYEYGWETENHICADHEPMQSSWVTQLMP